MILTFLIMLIVQPASTIVRLTQTLLLFTSLTPLLFYRPIFQYYTAPKAFFLFAISEIIFVLLIWQIPLWSSTKPARRAIMIALGVFIATQLFAGLLGEDIWNSLWSSPGRMTGIFLLIHLFGLFVAMIVLLKTAVEWRVLFMLNILVGLMISFLYWFPLFPALIEEANSGSTLGNSSVFGTYLVFLIGFAFLLILDDQSDKRIRVISSIGATVFILTLFATDAHASQISLIVGGALFMSLAMMRLQTRSWIRRVGYGLLIMLTASTVWISVMIFIPDSIIQKKFIDIGGPTRLILWDMAWQAIQERPLLGWGPENFSTVSLTYYNPCLGSAVCGQGAWSDRAHNIFLDIAVGSGLIGLLAYVAVFCTALYVLWKKRSSHRNDDRICVLITTLLCVYIVQNVTGFDSVISLWFWMIVLAFTQWKTSMHPVLPSPSQHTQPIMGTAKHARLVLPLTMLLLPLGLWYFVIQPTIGFQSLSASIQAQSIDDRLKFYTRATNVSRAGLAYRRSFMAYETSARLWYITPAQVISITPAAQQEIRLAKMGLMDTLEQTPTYLRASLMLARIYQVESRLFRPDALEDARYTLENAITLHPVNPLPRLALISVLIEHGDFEAAITHAQKALDLNPDDPKMHVARLITARFTLEHEDVQTLLTESLERMPEITEELTQIVLFDINAQRLAMLDTFY